MLCFACFKDIDGDRIEDYIICPYCNKEYTIGENAMERIILDITHNPEQVYRMRKLQTSNPEEYDRLYSLYSKKFKEKVDEKVIRNRAIAEEKERREKEANAPTCPYCKSKNLTRISAGRKVAKIGLFGIFGAGDLGKTYKCNNCDCKF